MAKGVLLREWDGFNLNRFHCTADTPEWRSSPFSLSIRRKEAAEVCCDVLLLLNLPGPLNVDVFPCSKHTFGGCACFCSDSSEAAAREQLFVYVQSLCNEVLQSTAAVDLEIWVKHSEGIGGQNPEWLIRRLGCLLLCYVPVCPGRMCWFSD